ncbi:hypothetical protein EIP91_007619 [Steccherinum ochraceum]|uniref:NADP-dependent oxidoreductase domain-containing protein n=1 Tax=Steccherinum ochraceum TaxID=92696 RepID=A0A4R0R415_9APHY|nr:hypothetical protein EIP91_007619 [Steccherinum ochraceum]
MSFLTIPIRKLSNGIGMPGVGLGGAPPGPTEEQRNNSWKWFLTGIQAGYRHLDTAARYKTEASIGKAIRESGIAREEFFVTTKIAWSETGDVQGAFERSLQNLGMDYVDLYLIHFPFSMTLDENGTELRNAEGDLVPLEKPTFNDVWAEFEKIYASGRAKAIGISNFSIKTIDELLATADVVPHVNQVECHPYLSQPKLKEYCDTKGIQLCAYTPSGYGIVRSHPVLLEFADKYNVTPNQVILAWHVMRGLVPIPRSTNAQRQKDNITLPALSDDDYNLLSKLNRNEHICNKIDSRGIVHGCTVEMLGW